VDFFKQQKEFLELIPQQKLTPNGKKTGIVLNH
jgi:hypothetical protein